MKKENQPIIITSIIAGVILLVAILTLTTFSPSSKNVVTVEGTSTIKAIPDLITVYYNIETKGNTSVVAKDANEVIYEKLKNFVKTIGFEESELRTQSYNIYPSYYWDGSKQKENGYVATHSLRIEFSTSELDRLGQLIDAGVNAGAGVSSINFELTTESQNKYKAEALKLASEDAQVKAEAVAQGFGKKAGKLISVEISEFGYYPWNVYSSAGRVEDNAVAKESAISISPSQQEIHGRVSAIFRI